MPKEYFFVSYNVEINILKKNLQLNFTIKYNFLSLVALLHFYEILYVSTNINLYIAGMFILMLSGMDHVVEFRAHERRHLLLASQSGIHGACW